MKNLVIFSVICLFFITSANADTGPSKPLKMVCGPDEFCAYKGILKGPECPVGLCEKKRRLNIDPEEEGDMADLNEALERIKNKKAHAKGIGSISISDCERLKVRYQDLPARCKTEGYSAQDDAALTALVKKVLAQSTHYTGIAQNNYCHANTSDEASFLRCTSLPANHDYGCGIPTHDGVYFESKDGACKKVERDINSESIAKKIQGSFGVEGQNSNSGNLIDEAK